MTPQQQFISFYTLVRKDVVRIMRIWSQTFLPSVVTTSLYYIVFGTFIGSQLPPISGFSYIQFIVPGLIMMAVITNAYSNTVSTFYFSKFQRNLDELIVSPTPEWVIVAGFVTTGVVRGLIVGLLVLIVSLFFTHLVIYSIPILLISILLTTVTFSLAGLLNGIFAKSFDAVSIVPTFVLTPLTYLGGVFYSINNFPEFWQHVSRFNPILYMVNAFRYGFLGVSDVNIIASFGIMLGMIVVFMTVILYLFKKGIGMKS